MALQDVGINLVGNYLSGELELVRALEQRKAAEADFLEICPHTLGVILGGRLDEDRFGVVKTILLEAGCRYTVHAPHRMNLMDLDSQGLHRSALENSVRFAAEIQAKVVVCHAGHRVGYRDARLNLRDQLAGERAALWRVGELAGNLGVTIALENSYPEPGVLNGTSYAYAVRPSDLAEQVAEVDHPAVGVCLDVGHAAVAASAFGFDFLEECGIAAPLVSHLHLHDNLGRPDPSAEGRVAERHAYGLGDLHLPPGRGAIPLGDLIREGDFAMDPACCVELRPDLSPLAGEAVEAARELTTVAVRAHS